MFAWNGQCICFKNLKTHFYWVNLDRKCFRFHFPPSLQASEPFPLFHLLFPIYVSTFFPLITSARFLSFFQNMSVKSWSGTATSSTSPSNNESFNFLYEDVRQRAQLYEPFFVQKWNRGTTNKVHRERIVSRSFLCK